MGYRLPPTASAIPLLIQLLLHALPLCANPESGVSFFGDGYVEMPSVSTYRSVQLRVQFYTSQQNGLLFLAAGQTDYLLLELRAGILQARIGLGPEELTVRAPAGPHLSDLVIHDADLLAAEGWMTLVVDGAFNASVEIPGPVQELNIDYGLYVGGMGSLELPYLTGVSPSFRGCLHMVTFNDHDILSALASGTSTQRSHGIREGCSVEFSAGPEDPLGFLGPSSYIAFPGWSARNQGTIEFVITTDVKQAPLIYHSGLENDFFYLEIFDGRLRGVVEKGNGLVVLHNNIYISNEQDHYVKVYMDVRKFEILVDYYASQTSNKGIHSYLDLQGPLFVGGLNEKAANRMRERGLAFLSGNEFFNRSFVGCMEDLRINQEKRSLQDALITRDITAGCGKLDQYSDYEAAYEQDEATTSSPPDHWQGPLMEPCRPDPSLPPVFTNFTKLLHVSPLVVAEGGTAFLEWRHTQPTIDLSSANIRQSQVLFSVTTDPRHGQLELDLSRVRNKRKFTLLDIVNRKVKYVHDGSEGPMDQLLLEVVVTARGEVPECLWQGQIYLLPIKINPVNDAPEVNFPHGDRMVILEHTRKHLTPEIIQALDDDSPCDTLRFQLLGGKRMEEGYVEYDFHPGVPIEEFSCRDLEAGHVAYVHQNGPTSTLILQVNDGMVMSPVATLRVVAVEPDIQVRNNTGLFVSQGGVVPVTTANLSVETNAVQQKVPILYRLTVPLQYGELQKQGTVGGEWKKVESFYQHDLEQGHIQYFSTDDEHRTEDMIEKLQFTVQVGQKTLRNNTFLIRIKRATVRMKTLIPLQMKNEKEKNITSALMEAVLEEPGSSPDAFRYVIIQPPQKGNLELRGVRLTEGFGFSQEDLQGHQLHYSATIRDSMETEDSFQFRIMSGEHYSPVYTYRIEIGGDPDAPILTNVLLSIPEGGQAIISKDHLFIKSTNSMNYAYEVIDGPTHGKLIRRTSEDSSSSEEVITRFTNEDILQGRLLYQHDSSETLEDDIPFVAIKQDEGSSDLEPEDVRGVFRVSIQPENNHAPVQLANKVFNVVRNGQRLMTTDDIAFIDEDSGFSDTQLVFVRKDILFGSIIAADDRSRQVYRFTQDDLRKKRILFVHSGADRGWIQFQVSDGQHQVAALLEVQASDPYIKINKHTTSLVIHQGSQGTIDSSVLSLETNMDIRNDEDFLFRIVASPKWGVVLRGGQEVSSFTQRDLLAGEVLYHHNGSRNTQDSIHLSIEANQVTVEDVLKVTIFLDSHPSPLNIVHHEKIHILQGEAVEIKNDYLLIEHEDIPSQEILYTVTVPPLSGFLVAVSHGQTTGEPPSLDPVQTFTQEDINEGKILYLHSSPEIQSDQFTMDVTANGVDPLEGLVVDLEILPISVPLEVHNFTVTEGSTQVLSVDILNIPNTYFTAHNVEFIVVKAPEHGVFQSVERPEEGRLSAFSWAEVEHRSIQYVHDGSETLADRFTVLANISEINRQSQPKTVSVNILPSNDEAPVLVVNLGLQIQEGGTAEITPDLLWSEDEDNPPEEVVYSIRTPLNGKIVLSAGNVVQRFTQAQINNRTVQFVHEGPLDGGFSFDVSDGENMSPGHFFSVKARKKVVITLENKQDLTVCPGSSQPIRSENLKAMTNDNEEGQSLFYIIKQPPQFGKLLNIQKGEAGGELQNFTQAEVDAGSIFYQHEMPSEPFWILEDGFQFQISSPSMITDPYDLRASISFKASCPKLTTRLWRNKGLTVPEAQSAVINVSLLDASNLLSREPDPERALYDVVFLITELPTYGTLSVPDGPVDRKHPYFLQSDLLAGGLEYSHHGSGTLDDHFGFSAWLRHNTAGSIQPPEKEKESVISGIFNITVRDSNEMPPRLVSKGRVLQVLQGSSIALSQEQLNVKDPDSSPEEIKYDILSGSPGGFVINVHDKQTPITQFTQADINAGRLMFIANGTSSAGTLDLAISDGNNPSVFTSLKIMVLPAFTWATNQTTLEIPQGLNLASISHNHLLGSLDQADQNTLYRLIREPQFGQVEVNRKTVTEFSQKQVDDEEVTFSFTEFASSEDEFQFLATSGEVNISGVVHVMVKALVETQQEVLWPRGTTIQLDTSVLDASELANRTKSIPEFKILRAPRGGQFVNVSSDQKNQPVPIDAFTQHDLERGLVALEIGEMADPEKDIQKDSFLFELVADGVPPASEAMTYTTEAFNSSASYGVTLLQAPSLHEASHSPTSQSITPSSQAFMTRPQESEKPSQNSSKPRVLPTVRADQGLPTSAAPAEKGTLLGFIEANMFSIILPICLILLLLALILPLLFYLHKRNKTGKHNVQGSPPKYKNGTLVDQETFRKTEHSQGFPLMRVDTLEAKEAGPNSKGAGPGGQQDPELLQYCRTSNPALKNSQYWV